MRTIVKLAILVGLALQSAGHPIVRGDEGWAWCDDSQETVHLEVRIYRLGWPCVVYKITESWGCEGLATRELAFRPLNLALTATAWVIILGLLDTLWPGGGDHA